MKITACSNLQSYKRPNETEKQKCKVNPQLDKPCKKDTITFRGTHQG